MFSLKLAFHHTLAMFLAAPQLEICVALKAAPPQGTTLYLVAAPTCTWKAFAHMLKTTQCLASFPGLFCHIFIASFKVLYRLTSVPRFSLRKGLSSAFTGTFPL